MPDYSNNKITTEFLLYAYSVGMFPMAKSANDHNIYWIEPEKRAIIPLDNFHISRSLKKIVRLKSYDIRVDTAFDQVISGCAENSENRKTTWINTTIRELYIELFHMGYGHSIEAWKEEKLMGGLYGICLKSAFFGESMFSRSNNASKVCLTYLLNHLRTRGFELLDIQFITNHLKNFGAIEINRQEYKNILEKALNNKEVLF
ncbi:Leucyl/phenylalanyl-tRNA--protein transferase [Liberibacter crescens BT-1]|uniref:Leucyl/phenylalanyl-tRNA--protein transferase n=1 Tax=Liberibacter crescens (strain BT-1) TaxID=1215343 RepID=L0ETN1_LIBCB|nr:leucyl/phenylalanyl-tRNA--protein transferase [Liberibacter crescens]AGA64904.1 Leucyl/phenylalanyl-tRNA--protein transferase [Liberibacter crescens BT-1]AMC12933.1 leucyl/phenylalanyl-tRNA--protein transferase [Liberibacter crescens]